MANSPKEDMQGSGKNGGAADQATEAGRKGGVQPAKEHAEREFEDSSKESGE